MTAPAQPKARLKVNAEKNIQDYFSRISTQALEQFEAASKAKEKGFDISTVPETKPTLDLADRTENIIGPKGIAERFRKEFEENQKDRIKTIFQLFKEIIMESDWYRQEDRQKRLEQAMRTALVLVTEGVVVAPLDGVPQIKISKNFDNSEFVDIYYAGPIRAAGGTAAVFPLILGDYAQKLLGLERYKPTNDEIERFAEEAKIYQEEIVSRQVKISEEQVRQIIKNCPVCINGEPTEEREVSVYRDLPRVQNNRIRGGAMLVITEGVLLKAKKILQYAKMLGLDWQWLEDLQQTEIKKTGDKEAFLTVDKRYLDRIAAGRPIFSYPMKPGGFRLRYGRGRNTGIMAKAVHPAAMHLLEGFIAVGTQLKVERPGKSAGMFPCDSIEGPIVLLNNDSVVKVKSFEDAEKIKPQVKEFLFLGDILVSFGDFRKTAHSLVPVGYCEEWWKLELEKALQEGKKPQGINAESFLQNPRAIDCFQAVELSIQLGIPLHPEFTHYYTLLEFEELEELVKAARNAEKKFEKDQISSANIQFSKQVKKILEKIGTEHKIIGEGIIIEKEQAYAFLKTLGALATVEANLLLDKEKTILENLNAISGLTIRDKAGTFIGTRMGRPEQAKPRKMIGNPNVLFPISLYGGSTRSVNKAMQSSESRIEVEIAMFRCEKCGKATIRNYCEKCGERTILLKHCKNCGKTTMEPECPSCKKPTTASVQTRIDLNTEVRKALNNLQAPMPEIVKGVKGLFSQDKIAEPLEKGILRAKHDLHIFRDGTIRFEMINAPLSHFKPKELGMSVEQAKSLGYEKDWKGKPLVSEEQTLELFMQDLVVNEGAGDFMLQVTKFIDELLEKFYKVPAFYNKKTRQDMIGELVLGLAPHTSAGIAGRIIGFTKARVLFAHPFFHLCKRRNVDGDQDSILLLMDALLNFSEKYLASSRGGRMDAPLVFTIALDPMEIDDEAYEMETCTEFPLELFEKSQKLESPFSIKVPIVAQKLGSKEQYSGLNFTHDTQAFDQGPKTSKYVELQSMEEKIKTQARLQQKIKAIDQKDALEKVLVSHFLPDIIGNTRAFSRQTFRCSTCNTKYRRIPLAGKCTKCGGHIILTVAHGSVIKYLEIAKQIIRDYKLSDYLRQRIELAEKEINSVFQNEKREQKSLFEYV
ncbi:MAG: DNA polymerase II large subunit [Candidatus Diapherotrites archaeon]|uniref:DNA polymerase II large subunit n=1 Tax=Candidatus Iainarchaeum sp. TaxID=3101447 RepID=A0A7J4JWV1_9ARCH|nr:DNA polymerase II large subunit [Candidatus Diapherotrites archaeon]HIH21934.1 DNA polymerase II large subunit [Candidatus Diapherotrites archaeon]